MIKQEKIPKDWERVKLDELFDFKNKTGRKAGEGIEKGNYKFFTSSVFQNKFINKSDFNGEFLIFGSGGNASLHYCNEAFSTSNDCFVVKVNEILTKYVYYYLTSKMYLLNEGFKGAGLKHISKGYIENINIIYPENKETQKKIVNILEKSEQAKNLREETNKLSENYLKSVFYEMFGDPIKNEKEWILKKLNEVGVLARGKSKHRPRNDPKLLGGKYPLIQTGDISNSKIYIKNYSQTYSEIGLKQSKLWSKGTLCVTIAANIGDTAILSFDACFPDSIVGFESNKQIKTEYVLFWFYFIKKVLDQKATQVAQKNINLKILNSLNIPIPPIKLQEKFANIVKKVEEMKKVQESSTLEVSNLFNVLMQKAFKGELV